VRLFGLPLFVAVALSLASPSAERLLASVELRPASQTGKGTPEELASRVQQRYDTVRDFEADFIQTYQGGLLRTKTTEQGTVEIKRPGKMRWRYTKPERKEFVSNGKQIYSYLPRDRQVIVAPVPAADQTTPALFLSGRGHLVRDFVVSFTELPGSAPGTVGLKLVPRKSDPEVEWLLLGVDATSLQIRNLVAMDRQGGRSTFVFENLKENRNLSDKIFEFEVPRGVDVITSGGLEKPK
jgi:outer membrane lipoprotein carrier protein